jgi:virulence-associated protein VagC
MPCQGRFGRPFLAGFGFANTADVSIVREGKRLVIAPSKAAWDGFFDSPGVDLPAHDQPALQDRESP